jgi:transposase
MMVTKAVRFQIVKPIQSSWEELGNVLRDLSYWTAKLCNFAVQLYWENHHFRLRYKNEKGKYPGAAEEKQIYGCTFRNHVYRRMRELYPLLASSNTSQTNQLVMNRWKNDISEVMKMQKSIPSFRLDGAPIQVANQNYRLSLVEGENPEYRVAVTLLGKEAEQSRFLLILDGGDGSKKAIFRRIMSEYKQGAMQIVRNKRKKKWFCVVAYSFEPEKVAGIDENRVMGVNFACSGEAVTWTFNYGHKRGNIPISEIEAAETKIAAITKRRREMQRSIGSSGHGRKRRLAATENSQGKATQIRDAIAHKYSRRIVDIAAVNQCGTIRLADMSGVELENGTKRFTWAALAEKIRYKAEEKGMVVQKSDRQKALYTCSRCGYSNPENIEKNSAFLTCKNEECGSKTDMAYNAARNIAFEAEAK